MQKASLTTAIETGALLSGGAVESALILLVLLQLHRSYFTRVISGSEGMVNRSHRLIPSCVAVYLGASRMIAIVQDLYDREPELTARMLGYWSNTFSAAVRRLDARDTIDFILTFESGGSLSTRFPGSSRLSGTNGIRGTRTSTIFV